MTSMINFLTGVMYLLDIAEHKGSIVGGTIRGKTWAI